MSGFLRRPQPTNAGRTEFQLSLPYPGNTTPEGVQANFRALEQWGNRLPIARSSNFKPYIVQYDTTASPEQFPEFTLSQMWQAKYGTDIVPAGTWLVLAFCTPYTPALPPGVVGLRVIVNVGSGLDGIGNTGYAFAGYFDSEAIRVVKDIDFVTPEVTYEWVLPTIGDLSIPYAQTWAICTFSGDGGINVTGSADYEVITDPDVGPELTNGFPDVVIGCIAYRLTDYYDTPYGTENVNP